MSSPDGKIPVGSVTSLQKKCSIEDLSSSSTMKKILIGVIALISIIVVLVVVSRKFF